MTTPKPLTADDIAEWKAGYGSQPTGVARDVLRLIATIEQRDEQIEGLRSALERTEHNFRLSVAGKPVRDMQENLAENATALASIAPEQPADTTEPQT